MRTKTFTVIGSTGGASHSPAYPLDIYNNPANIGIGVTVSGVHTIVDVQHTFTDPYSVNLNASVSANAWVNNATLASATQANTQNGTTDTNYGFYPTAVRLRVRALASASVGERATMTIIQAGAGE